MNYIYNDIDGGKHVGELRNVRAIPSYHFTVELERDNTGCWLECLSNSWSVYITIYEKTVDLAHPADLFWNTEAIFHEFDDWDAAGRIAGAIRKVYEKYEMEK